MDSLPVWYGFNLQEKFYRNDSFKELDFKRASEWGFNFFRLPMDYRQWVVDDDPYKVNEKVLKGIDEAVALGKKYGVHVDLNLHRAPGYTVNRSVEEPFNLWEDEEALDACEFHWRLFARRYKGLSNKLVSFNLVNEPHGTTMPIYKRFVERILEAIREEDRGRLVIADGLIAEDWGRYEPVPDIGDPMFAQSFHIYEPMWLTHYGAIWLLAGYLYEAGCYIYEEPAKYPGVPPRMKRYLERLPSQERPERLSPERRLLLKHLHDFYSRYAGIRIDKSWLEDYLKLWLEFREETGSIIHCGEMGVFASRVDRSSQLNWYRDVLELLRKNRIGWALWTFRGSFGVINTGREEFHSETLPNGDRLDRELLNLVLSQMKQNVSDIHFLQSQVGSQDQIAPVFHQSSYSRIRALKELLKEKAWKARDYSCESLYLDLGWDSDFDTFLRARTGWRPRRQSNQGIYE